MAASVSPAAEPTTLEGHVARLMNEGLEGPSSLARYLGTCRAGRPAHPSRVGRYMLDGVTLAGGRVVRLEHVRVNGRLMSTRAAVLRFLTSQQLDAPAAAVRAAGDRTARTAGSEAAEAELIAAGC